MSLGKILEKIQEDLRRREEARQEIQTAMRKVTRLSKETIFLIHRENLEEAERKLEEAKKLLCELDGLSKDYPELAFSGIVNAAFQEYTEAYTFLRLVKERRFASFEEIDVPGTSYVLGLADVIGELRRRVLDLVRKGRVEEAEDCLELMETVYVELTNTEDLYFLVSELRRKCDIARRVIEATRGDVTVEVRRSSLEHSIMELQKSLKEKEKNAEA